MYILTSNALQSRRDKRLIVYNKSKYFASYFDSHCAEEKEGNYLAKKIIDSI
jgi:hypothetical protein